MQILLLVFTVILAMGAALATAAGLLNLLFRVMTKLR
jgi:hypothetical protein